MSRRRTVVRLLVVAVGALTLGACLPAPGTITTSVAGDGTEGYAGDGSLATEAQLASPMGVAIDGDGNVVVADTDNHRVRRVDADGIITTVAGTGVAGYSGDGGAATTATLNEPTAVAVDGDGTIYIADHQNHVVRAVAPGGTIATVAGTGTPGTATSGAPASSSALHLPFGVAVDDADQLLVADTGNHQVHRVDGTGVLWTIAGTGAPGSSGDGGPATAAQLASPTGVAVFGELVHIADLGNHRVRTVDDAGVISTLAGNGTPGFSGDGGAATAAQFDVPASVAVGADGSVYVADRDNQRIRRVLNGIVATVAGCGLDCVADDGELATEAFLWGPYGLAVAPSGDLYVADADSHRIRRMWPGGGSIGGRVTHGDDALEGITVQLYYLDELVANDVSGAGGWYGFPVAKDGYVLAVEGGANAEGPWWQGTGETAFTEVVPVDPGQQVRFDLDLSVLDQ